MVIMKTNILYYYFYILNLVTFSGKLETHQMDKEKGENRNVGPYFINQPPKQKLFSNNTGAVITCEVGGYPEPRVSWMTIDGSRVEEVVGLRQFLVEASLIFYPFSSTQLNAEIHNNVYYCIAENTFGAIRSRDVTIKAVIDQHYHLKVTDAFSIVGSFTTIQCHIPKHAQDILMIEAWYHEDDRIFTTSDLKDSNRYKMMTDGSLYIRQVKESDAGLYHCMARNRLTGDLTPNSTKGMLKVTDLSLTFAPKVVSKNGASIKAHKGDIVNLCCHVQAFPFPRYSWFKEENKLTTQVVFSSNVYQIDECLVITSLHFSNQGRYICNASNDLGQQKFALNLIVTLPLTVTIMPSKIYSQLNKSVLIKCTVKGYPISKVDWFKDGKLLTKDTFQTIRSETERISEIQIKSLNQEDAGMYQCFGQNELESDQFTMHLYLKNIKPIFIKTFGDHYANPSSSVSFNCIATGSPLPQIYWSFEDTSISEEPRFYSSDYVNSNGHVISYLNVSKVKIVDSGEFKCSIVNSIGQSSHSAKLYVYGPPTLRSSRDINLNLVAGKIAKLRCPVVGYPIEVTEWKHNEMLLPNNHRQNIEQTNEFESGHILVINDVQKPEDEGKYTCSVRGPNSNLIKATILIQIKVAPLIDTQTLPFVTYAEEGMRVKLICSVTQGERMVHLEWYKNGIMVIPNAVIVLENSEDFSLLTFKKVTFTDRGNYTCKARNDAGVDFRSSWLVVNVPPKWALEPKSHIFVASGSKVFIDCSSIGFPKPNIKWSKLYKLEKLKDKNGQMTHFENIEKHYRYTVFKNGTLVISDVSQADTGYLLCQASNGYGAGLSKVTYLRVQMPPYFQVKFEIKTSIHKSSTQLKCEVTGDKPIDIKWIKDEQVVDKDRIEIKMDESEETTISKLFIKSVQRQDAGLYWCKATNHFGVDHSQVRLIVQEVPDVPHKLKIMERSSQGVIVSWQKPFEDNASSTKYILEYQEVDKINQSWKEVIVNKDNHKFSLNNLTPYSNYTIRMRAVNNAGKSESSDEVYFQTDQEVPGGPPLDVQAESIGPHSFMIEWKPPKAELRFGQIKGYYIGYRLINSKNSFSYRSLLLNTINKNDNEMSINLTNLKHQATYEVTVQAFNEIGTGPKSEAIKVTTCQNFISSDLSVINTTFNSIAILWNINIIPAISKGHDFMVFYQLEGSGNWSKKLFKPLGRNEFILEALKCGSIYVIFVTAFDNHGLIEESKKIIAKTNGTLPTPPSSIHNFVQIFSNSVILNLSEWNNSKCSIHSFVIKYRSAKDNRWLKLSVNENSPKVNIDNLLADHLYFLMVITKADPGSTQAQYEFTTLNQSHLKPIQFKHAISSPTSLSSFPNSFVVHYFFALSIPFIFSTLIVIISLAIFLFIRWLNQKPSSIVTRSDFNLVTDNNMTAKMTHCSFNEYSMSEQQVDADSHEATTIDNKLDDLVYYKYPRSTSTFKEETDANHYEKLNTKCSPRDVCNKNLFNSSADKSADNSYSVPLVSTSSHVC